MSDKTLILVIGCHRSGTSAVAGCLAQMGVNLGGDLLGPAFDNPKGFFENRAVVALHNRVLSENGGSWDRPSTIERGRVAAREWMIEIIRALPGPVCAIKDPRASLFVDLWARACEEEGVRLCVLEVQREFKDVSMSLSQREGWDVSRSDQLVREYGVAIASARATWGRPWGWQIINFPTDLGSEFAWRSIFDGFDLPALGWEGELDAIRAFFDRRLIHHGVDTPPLWTVIIPSRDDEKVLDCVASLVEAQPEIEANQIVIVDDGLSWRTRRELAGVTWVKGVKPFVFSRAINMGAAARDCMSDLVILGDDVRIETPRALDRLASHSAGAAAVAPEVVGVCGQFAQRAGSAGNSADWLAFICAYIPRRAWDAVGPLDERFVGYGYDDVDWCKRARNGNDTLKIAHDVRVEHLRDSSYRSQADWKARYEENRVRFEEKWRPKEVA
jgi:hypothetical protein